MAPADPGADAPHRRGRGRDRQHHDRPQHGPRATTPSSARPTPCSSSTAPIRASSRPASPPPRNGSGRSTSSATARSPSRAASRRWTSARRTRTAPTAASSSRSARAATRRAAGEVAVTDGVAKLLRLELGSTLALDGRRRTVVGIVENPRKLSDEFALVSPFVRGRAGPRHGPGRRRATRRVDVLRRPRRPTTRPAFAGYEDRGNDQPAADAGDVLRDHRLPAPGLAGRRRGLRGRRAATAPPARHARRRSAPRRSTFGSCSWPTARSSARSPRSSGRSSASRSGSSFAPTLESAVDHRIDRLSLPWALIALTVARSPSSGRPPPPGGRGAAVARLPVMLALSGRPPRPRPARHSAIAAAALIAVGIGCLALSDRDRPPLIVAGIVATILGCLLLGPLAIRVFSRRRRAGLRSRRGWRCETSSATRPAPERRSPRSRSRSASRRRSSSSPRPRRRRRRPSRPTCPTGRSASTSARRRSGAHPGRRTRPARPPGRARPTARRPARRRDA